jgi:hypothetical protein
LIAVNREIDYRTADITIGLNKCFELNMKSYEVVILTAVAINGDSVDSAGIDLKIDAVKILMVFVFIRNVDIY